MEIEKLPHALATETHLYDEVSLPSSINCSLLHHSDHPPLIVRQTLQVLLSLGHDATILLCSTVRDLDKGRREIEYGYSTSTRRKRERRKEREREREDAHSAGLLCCD